MIREADFSAPILLLYLAAYAMAAAGFLLPIIPKSEGIDRRTRASGRFLQVLALTGIIPSLQVILSGLGITENLPGVWPAVANLILNDLIIAGLWGVVVAWSATARAFSPTRWFIDRFHKPVFITTAALAGVNLLLQAAALFIPQNGILLAAEIGLLILIILLALSGLAATVRIYRPVSGVTAGGTGLLLKIFTPLVLVFSVLSLVLPYPGNLTIPPLALIVVFSLTISLFLRQSADSSDPEAARETLFDDAGMTPREREIALMLAEGLSYKEISEKLFISLSTIQTHVTRIYTKMDVRSKTELSRKITGS